MIRSQEFKKKKYDSREVILLNLHPSLSTYPVFPGLILHPTTSFSLNLSCILRSTYPSYYFFLSQPILYSIRSTHPSYYFLLSQPILYTQVYISILLLPSLSTYPVYSGLHIHPTPSFSLNLSCTV